MLLYSLLHLTGYDLVARRPQAVPPVGLADAGPPRVRPDAGRRGDHRAARPGLRQRGRAWPSPSAASRPSSTATATTIVDHWTYVHRLRRRPPGGHRVRGGQPRRPPPARQAGRPLRRQPHPARRPDVDGLVARTSSRASRPTAGTPSGSRTATTSRRSRRRSRPPAATTGRASSRSGRTSATAARTSRTRQKAHGSPLGPDEVRLDQGGLRLGPGQDVLRPGRRARRLPRGGARRASALVADVGGRGSTAYAAAHPDLAAEFQRRIARRLPAGWDADLTVVRDRRRGRDPQRQPGRDPGAGAARCPSSSVAPPTCPSRT